MIKPTILHRSTKRASTSSNETSSSTFNEDERGMACRHPLRTNSVFGPDTSLAHLDPVPSKHCSSSPHGPRLHCAPGFGIQYILVTMLTIIGGEGNPPARSSFTQRLPVIYSFSWAETRTTRTASPFSCSCFCVPIPTFPNRVLTLFYPVPSGGTSIERKCMHSCILCRLGENK